MTPVSTISGLIIIFVFGSIISASIAVGCVALLSLILLVLELQSKLLDEVILNLVITFDVSDDGHRPGLQDRNVICPVKVYIAKRLWISPVRGEGICHASFTPVTPLH
jgi:hypothetical protein